jgi:uncharacterized membrane protein YeaQ/YmgE (transglycosylase-associated protein family)
MELTADQIFLVGLVASGLDILVRYIASKMGKEIHKGWMTAIVAGLSLVLTVIFNAPELPVYTEPLQYLGEWSTLIAAYVGAATAIYNIILSKVLEKLPSFM